MSTAPPPTTTTSLPKTNVVSSKTFLKTTPPKTTVPGQVVKTSPVVAPGATKTTTTTTSTTTTTGAVKPTTNGAGTAVKTIQKPLVVSPPKIVVPKPASITATNGAGGAATTTPAKVPVVAPKGIAGKPPLTKSTAPPKAVATTATSTPAAAAADDDSAKLVVPPTVAGKVVSMTVLDPKFLSVIPDESEEDCAKRYRIWGLKMHPHGVVIGATKLATRSVNKNSTELMVKYRNGDEGDENAVITEARWVMNLRHVNLPCFAPQHTHFVCNPATYHTLPYCYAVRSTEDAMGTSWDTIFSTPTVAKKTKIVAWTLQDSSEVSQNRVIKGALVYVANTEDFSTLKNKASLGFVGWAPLRSFLFNRNTALNTGKGKIIPAWFPSIGPNMNIVVADTFHGHKQSYGIQHMDDLACGLNDDAQLMLDEQFAQRPECLFEADWSELARGNFRTLCGLSLRMDGALFKAFDLNNTLKVFLAEKAAKVATEVAIRKAKEMLALQKNGESDAPTTNIDPKVGGMYIPHEDINFNFLTDIPSLGVAESMRDELDNMPWVKKDGIQRIMTLKLSKDVISLKQFVEQEKKKHAPPSGVRGRKPKKVDADNVGGEEGDDDDGDKESHASESDSDDDDDEDKKKKKKNKEEDVKKVPVKRARKQSPAKGGVGRPRSSKTTDDNKKGADTAAAAAAAAAAIATVSDSTNVDMTDAVVATKPKSRTRKSPNTSATNHALGMQNQSASAAMSYGEALLKDVQFMSTLSKASAEMVNHLNQEAIKLSPVIISVVRAVSEGFLSGYHNHQQKLLDAQKDEVKPTRRRAPARKPATKRKVEEEGEESADGMPHAKRARKDKEEGEEEEEEEEETKSAEGPTKASAEEEEEEKKTIDDADNNNNNNMDTTDTTATTADVPIDNATHEDGEEKEEEEEQHPPIEIE